MFYYWQTKYTALIYITFFIFPHNRHFFVHISPSVMEVWKFPCGRTPFQPSEDTDALLSESPLLSHNAVHAADPSQIRKDGSRRVPDQGTRIWGFHLLSLPEKAWSTVCYLSVVEITFRDSQVFPKKKKKKKPVPFYRNKKFEKF